MTSKSNSPFISGLSVVIPFYNDLDGLKSILPSLSKVLKKLKISTEIVVVDDASVSPLEHKNLNSSNIKILRSESNKGYGASIKKGIRASQYSHVIILDSDGQHDPNDIPQFLEKISTCDVVVGLRTNSESSPFWRRPGKWFLTLMINFLSPHPLKDINCGFRCFRREVILKYMHLCSDRFSFSISSTLIGLSLDYEIKFLNIVARPRIGSSSISIITGFDTIVLIIRMIVLTNPLRLFLPLTFLFFLLGFSWSLPYFLQGKGLSVGALLLFLSGFFVFFLGIVSDQIKSLIKSHILK